MKRLSLSLAAVSLAACSAGPVVPAGTISFALSVRSDQCGIERADVTVVAPELSSEPVTTTLDVADQRLAGQLDRVPAGPARTVTVKAYNATNVVVYEGSAVVDIKADEVAPVSLTLYRNFTSCPSTAPTPTEASGGVSVTTDLDNEFLAFDFSSATRVGDRVLFVDDAGKAVRTLDLPTLKLAAPIALGDNVSAVAVAPDDGSLYVAYGNGRIDVIGPDGERAFFGSAAARISTLAVAGAHVFAVDASGAWGTHSLFDRTNGIQTSLDDWRHGARDAVYSPSQKKVFTLHAGVSPTDIAMTPISDDGKLGAEQDSPYHGDYDLPAPLRLFPDESKVVVGSGVIFSTTDLKYAGNLGFSFEDLAFVGDKLYLLRDGEVVVLDARYALVDRFPLSGNGDGTVRRIFPRGSDLVVVTKSAGGIRFATLAQ